MHNSGLAAPLLESQEPQHSATAVPINKKEVAKDIVPITAARAFDAASSGAALMFALSALAVGTDILEDTFQLLFRIVVYLSLAYWALSSVHRTVERALTRRAIGREKAVTQPAIGREKAVTLTTIEREKAPSLDHDKTGSPTENAIETEKALSPPQDKTTASTASTSQALTVPLADLSVTAAAPSQERHPRHVLAHRWLSMSSLVHQGIESLVAPIATLARLLGNSWSIKGPAIAVGGALLAGELVVARGAGLHLPFLDPRKKYSRAMLAAARIITPTATTFLSTYAISSVADIASALYTGNLLPENIMFPLTVSGASASAIIAAASALALACSKLPPRWAKIIAASHYGATMGLLLVAQLPTFLLNSIGAFGPSNFETPLWSNILISAIAGILGTVFGVFMGKERLRLMTNVDAAARYAQTISSRSAVFTSCCGGPALPGTESVPNTSATTADVRHDDREAQAGAKTNEATEQEQYNLTLYEL